MTYLRLDRSQVCCLSTRKLADVTHTFSMFTSVELRHVVVNLWHFVPEPLLHKDSVDPIDWEDWVEYVRVGRGIHINMRLLLNTVYM